MCMGSSDIHTSTCADRGVAPAAISLTDHIGETGVCQTIAGVTGHSALGSRGGSIRPTIQEVTFKPLHKNTLRHNNPSWGYRFCKIKEIEMSIRTLEYF